MRTGLWDLHANFGPEGDPNFQKYPSTSGFSLPEIWDWDGSGDDNGYGAKKGCFLPSVSECGPMEIRTK